MVSIPGGAAIAKVRPPGTEEAETAVLTHGGKACKLLSRWICRHALAKGSVSFQQRVTQSRSQTWCDIKPKASSSLGIVS